MPACMLATHIKHLTSISMAVHTNMHQNDHTSRALMLFPEATDEEVAQAAAIAHIHRQHVQEGLRHSCG